MSATPPATTSSAAEPSVPESECEVHSLREAAFSSTLSSVSCYGVNRCVIQAQAADGQSILIACQHTLSIDSNAASALLKDAGQCSIASLRVLCRIYLRLTIRRASWFAGCTQRTVFEVAG
jgi:hypothetical protein